MFLRAGKMAELDKRKTEVQHAAASAIQRNVRGYLARKHYAASRAAVITMQAAARGMAARSLARSLRRQKAATLIQAFVRRWQARQRFVAAVRAAVVVQAAYRGWRARLHTRDVKQHRAALVIQSQWRRHRAQSSYLRYRSGVVVAQVRVPAGQSVSLRPWPNDFLLLLSTTLLDWQPPCPTLTQSLWRSKCARRELRRRRTEAREAGKLMQDKQALEVKLREVQNVLEAVQNQRNDLRQQYRVRRCAAPPTPAPISRPSAHHTMDCFCTCRRRSRSARWPKHGQRSCSVPWRHRWHRPQQLVRRRQRPRWRSGRRWRRSWRLRGSRWRPARRARRRPIGSLQQRRWSSRASSHRWSGRRRRPRWDCGHAQVLLALGCCNHTQLPGYMCL